MSTSDYTVGYGKPPKHTQFQPGQSGNPAGRPRGTKNFATDLQEELAQEIIVTENGVPHKVTKQRAMVKSLLALALKGDVRAMALIDRRVGLLDGARTHDPSTDILDQDDKAILAAYREQLLAGLDADLGEDGT